MNAHDFDREALLGAAHEFRRWSTRFYKLNLMLERHANGGPPCLPEILDCIDEILEVLAEIDGPEQPSGVAH